MAKTIQKRKSVTQEFRELAIGQHVFFDTNDPTRPYSVARQASSKERASLKQVENRLKLAKCKKEDTRELEKLRDFWKSKIIKIETELAGPKSNVKLEQRIAKGEIVRFKVTRVANK